MNIIVVDDLSPIALTYKAILLRAGHEVEVFTRSEEALEHLKTNAQDFDLLVTDIYMDHINGVELIEQAKAINPGIKTLSVTGGGGFDQDTALMDKAREMSDFLAFKPINSIQLVNMANNLLGKEDSAANVA